MSNIYLNDKSKNHIRKNIMFQELDEDNYVINGRKNILKYHFVSGDFKRILMNCLESKAIISEEQMESYQRNLKPFSNPFIYTDPC